MHVSAGQRIDGAATRRLSKPDAQQGGSKRNLGQNLYFCVEFCFHSNTKTSQTENKSALSLSHFTLSSPRRVTTVFSCTIDCFEHIHIHNLKNARILFVMPDIMSASVPAGNSAESSIVNSRLDSLVGSVDRLTAKIKESCNLGSGQAYDRFCPRIEVDLPDLAKILETSADQGWHVDPGVRVLLNMFSRIATLEGKVSRDDDKRRDLQKDDDPDQNGQVEHICRSDGQIFCPDKFDSIMRQKVDRMGSILKAHEERIQGQDRTIRRHSEETGRARLISEESNTLKESVRPDDAEMQGLVDDQETRNGSVIKERDSLQENVNEFLDRQLLNEAARDTQGLRIEELEKAIAPLRETCRGENRRDQGHRISACLCSASSIVLNRIMANPYRDFAGLIFSP